MAKAEVTRTVTTCDGCGCEMDGTMDNYGPGQRVVSPKPMDAGILQLFTSVSSPSGVEPADVCKACMVRLLEDAAICISNGTFNGV